jgi:uncharacterized phage protein (TIGR01671 family)
MRAIKFRGLSINGKWHYGLLSRADEKKGVIEKGFYISNQRGIPFAYQIRPETVGEYTGIKDKNGKEIYEGDIVGVPYIDPMGGIEDNYDPQTVFAVVFNNGEFSLKRPEFNQPLSSWLKKEQGEYISNFGNRTIITDEFLGEVIGNIYENPELVKYN